MEQLCIEVCDNFYKYDVFLLKENAVIKKPHAEITRTRRTFKRRKVKYVDCAFLHYLAKEFFMSDVYRISFLRFYTDTIGYILKFVLTPTKVDLIDYKW